MAAYIHGNLATQERQAPGQRVKIKETRRIVYRTSKLPVQEKLLYLFTVFVCVIVAGVIIWRYAQIYEINTRIQQIERKIHQLEVENSSLKELLSKQQDPERLKNEFMVQGWQMLDQDQLIRVPAIE